MTFSFRPAKTANAIQQTRPLPFTSRYVVDEYGAVVNAATLKILRPAPRARGGYLGVCLFDDESRPKTWFVHQLVTIAFYGPRPTPQHQASHRDGNKLNNHYLNLRWCTRAENEADKILHGTSNHGDRNGMSLAVRKRRGEI